MRRGRGRGSGALPPASRRVRVARLLPPVARLLPRRRPPPPARVQQHLQNFGKDTVNLQNRCSILSEILPKFKSYIEHELVHLYDCVNSSMIACVIQMRSYMLGEIQHTFVKLLGEADFEVERVRQGSSLYFQRNGCS